MPIILSKRNTSAIEWMDKPDCDLDMLFTTYHHFGFINRVLSRWKRIYIHYIKPSLKPGRIYSLLDIGFGGADIIRYIDQWSKKDNFRLQITGIETDSRALDFVGKLEWPGNFHFEKVTFSELAGNNYSYDFVISNHLIHHLEQEEIRYLFNDTEKLCSKKALFNDIKRSDIAYFFFKIMTQPFFRNSFITQDGLISIQRSYTLPEIKKLIPPNWQVHTLKPYRLLLEYQSPE